MAKAPSKMTARGTDNAYGTVVETLKPLRETDTTSLQVRIMDKRGERTVDVRTFIDSPSWTGFTKAGLRMTAAEFAALQQQAPRIMRLLTPGRKAAA